MLSIFCAKLNNPPLYTPNKKVTQMNPTIIILLKNIHNDKPTKHYYVRVDSMQDALKNNIKIVDDMKDASIFYSSYTVNSIIKHLDQLYPPSPTQKYIIYKYDSILNIQDSNNHIGKENKESLENDIPFYVFTLSGSGKKLYLNADLPDGGSVWNWNFHYTKVKATTFTSIDEAQQIIDQIKQETPGAYFGFVNIDKRYYTPKEYKPPHFKPSPLRPIDIFPD